MLSTNSLIISRCDCAPEIAASSSLLEGFSTRLVRLLFHISNSSSAFSFRALASLLIAALHVLNDRLYPTNLLPLNRSIVFDLTASSDFAMALFIVFKTSL